MMGVSGEDSFIVAELIGIKTFLNEFVAYQKLSEYIKRREAGGPEYVNNVKQYISVSHRFITADYFFMACVHKMTQDRVNLRDYIKKKTCFVMRHQDNFWHILLDFVRLDRRVF